MRRPLFYGCVCLVLLLAMVFRLTDAPPWSCASAAELEGSQLTLTGQVYQKETRTSYGREYLLLYLRSIQISDNSTEISRETSIGSDIDSIENLICEITKSDLEMIGAGYEPGLGSHVRVTGTLRGYEHATNPGEFDLADYYMIQRVCGSLRKAQLLGESGSHWIVREWLYKLREKLRDRLYMSFPQKEASLLAKMLLGENSGLDAETRALYQRNGIVHILAISGLHITMIGMGIYKGLRKCGGPIIVAALCGGTFIVLYGAMTGFGVSACRAVGMYLVRMLGELLGRSYDMLTAMGVLMIVMVCHNPRWLYHSGFLLSFGSVGGIGLLFPALAGGVGQVRLQPGENKIKFLLRRGAARTAQGLLASLSVSLFTLPVQLWYFYRIPVYSPFLNLLVLPLVGVVMAAGGIVMLFPGMRFLNPVVQGIFAWYELLCRAADNLPGRYWLTGRPQAWKIVLYYAGLAGLLCIAAHADRNRRLRFLRLGGSLALAFFLGIRGGMDFTVHFLDVGQGDCICIMAETGEVYLFDGGSSSRSSVGEDVIAPFLRYYGVSYVDGVFVSHSDRDHINGILELLDGEDMPAVGALYLPDVGERSRQELAVLEEAAERSGTPVLYLANGAAYEKGRLRFLCLHPDSGMEGEPNACSLCMLVEWGTFRLLLTGDVEGAGERALTAELERRDIREIDVLKTAHHGSGYSTSEDFLEAVEVKTAVISCGRDNTYGHPHKELLERLRQEGCRIFRTDEEGWICIK